MGRPALWLQNLLFLVEMRGIIGLRPSVTSLSQAALIVIVIGLIPSANSTSQESCKISTSGGAWNDILGKPRTVPRTGIVGVIVMW